MPKTMRNLPLLICLVCLIVAVLCPAAWAQVRLPQVFASHMVLQRERPIPVWGWADPGVTVTVRFAGQEHTAPADEAGRWRVDLPAQQANAQGQSLIVTDGSETLALEDVLVGDNWLCSGQSNMAWAMSGQVIGAEEAIASANYPQIRLYRQKGHRVDSQPRLDADASWSVCSPETVRQFSAVAFYFGRMIHEQADVPVGLLHISWSGQRIEPFTAPEGFATVPELAGIHRRVIQADATRPESHATYTKYLDQLDAWLTRARESLAQGKGVPDRPRDPGAVSSSSPSAIYHAMIHPITPIGLKGAIWYQGESNGGEGKSYYHKMHALIEGWRDVFENPDLAFYWVQLANFAPPTDDPAGGNGWSQLREAQLHALSIPNTGMAVAIDIGEAIDIHPRNKKDVGERLAQWALHQTYGQADRVPSGPLYRDHAIADGKVRITFDHVGSGLMVGSKQGLAPAEPVADGELAAFAVADDQGVWYWARARIEGPSVVVWSKKVSHPVAVRYAFSMNPAEANLYNKDGLPASPFRTDHPYGETTNSSE